MATSRATKIDGCGRWQQTKIKNSFGRIFKKVKKSCARARDPFCENMKKKEKNIVPLVMLGALTIYLISPKKTASPGGGSAGGSSTMPRGLRNNNIGNIKINSNNNWQGKIPISQNTDGVFEQFTAKEYGSRAMLMLLKKYYDVDGLMSIYDIIKKYAPNSTQPGKQYIPFVANKMNTISTGFLDRKKLIELAVHMAQFENGQPATTIEELIDVNKKFNIGL